MIERIGVCRDRSIFISHYIHFQLPQGKCVVMVRNPVEHLHSSYIWFEHLYNQNTSPANFHIAVKEVIIKFSGCLNHIELSHLHCGYARLSSDNLLVQLRVGLYYLHVQTWLTTFPADQLMLMRLDDFPQNTSSVLENICTFLGGKHIPMEGFQQHTKTTANKSHKNDSTEYYNRFGQTLDETRNMLMDFYKPCNIKLAELLNDERFLFHGS